MQFSLMLTMKALFIQYMAGNELFSKIYSNKGLSGKWLIY